MGTTGDGASRAGSLLIRRAELTAPFAAPFAAPAPGSGGPRGIADVRIAGGRIVTISAAPLRAARGQPVLDADGAALLPGLHDHHVHLLALAAAASSVRAGPPQVTDAAGLRDALHTAAASSLASAGAGAGAGWRWVRAVGYHPSVAGDLDRHRLDALLADQPVRIQHRGGALWVLNSLALRLAGVADCPLPGVERDAAGHPTGRLWRLDDWLRRAAPIPRVGADLAALGRRAAAAGITGFTDATPGRADAERQLLADAARTGTLPQRLVLMRPEPGSSAPGSSEPSAAAGERGPHTATPEDGAGGERGADGPVKIILDDDRLPGLAALAERFAAAHRGGHPVAVHCVTRTQTVLTLAALELAGPAPGDRLEHAAVVPAELHGALRRAGLTVVTQPNFIAERGDRYRADVVEEDPATLYPAASLLRAGIRLAAGTDAPFGDPDPWRAIRAALDRRTAGGTVLGAPERLTAAAALALFLGEPGDPARPRVVRAGAPADLCLLDRPLAAALADPSSSAVRHTIVAGTPLG
ncbi:amidohydrolase family protein [Frankia sp. AgB32]|uniref:amidohydrolase family protein n=1 Tax=Frankia sp. AgB32 TaxID=631119 RepID=UPI00200F8D26|nr:amidohydrolase family protein [Frankia sp. AgB32]MCK9895992.1 amidohydrolase family protein [Frankia sp. AgB32]